MKRLLFLLLALVPIACDREPAAPQENPAPSGSEALPKDTTPPSDATPPDDAPPKRPQLELVDILSIWEERFAAPLPGSYDGALPELSPERRQELEDLLGTATTTSRSMRRFATRAAEDLAAAGDEAAAALAAWIDKEETPQHDAERAFACFYEDPPPALVSACLRWMDDDRAWLRRASYILLSKTGSAHVLPRMLRRLKYELDLQLFAVLSECIADLGNPEPMRHLLQRLDIPEQRDLAAQTLIYVLHRFAAEPYVAADGWAGLRNKTWQVLRSFKAEGKLLDALRPPIGAAEDAEARRAASGAMEPLAQREWWLFVKHLGGEQLRPVDDARFVGRQSGEMAVPLIHQSVLASDNYIRVHSIEIARQIGKPARSCGDRILLLLEDRFARSYALETFGAIHDERSLDTYAELLAPGSKAPQHEQVAALKGLASFGHPRGVAIALPFLEREETPLELRAYAASALDLCARTAQQRGRGFLQQLLDEDKFHAPTLRELLAK